MVHAGPRLFSIQDCYFFKTEICCACSESTLRVLLTIKSSTIKPNSLPPPVLLLADITILLGCSNCLVLRIYTYLLFHCAWSMELLPEPRIASRLYTCILTTELLWTSLCREVSVPGKPSSFNVNVMSQNPRVKCMSFCAVCLLRLNSLVPPGISNTVCVEIAQGRGSRRAWIVLVAPSSLADQMFN